jgi:hypothetical protein
MQTSRFQLGLIATLALALGFSIASQQAVAYPSPAVSTGSNPVVSTGGTLERTDSVDLFVAPVDQDLIITDVAFDMEVEDVTCMSTVVLTFSLGGSGEILGRRTVSMVWWSNNFGAHTKPVDSAMVSGMRIPAGETAVLTANTASWDSCSTSNSVIYTVAGYYARP